MEISIVFKKNSQLKRRKMKRFQIHQKVQRGILSALAFLTLGTFAYADGHAMLEKNIVETYANIAEAVYEDSLTEAKRLRAAVNEFLANPTEVNLQKTKQAWLNARVPYQQSEVYRFGNAIVDDWEGKVNAWPLDEGLIDYVDASYGKDSDENPLYSADVIAHKTIKIGGKTVKADLTSKEFLSDVLQEADQVEANVATGYHAIEFLLWGQDLNGTKPGAGNRPATDYGLTQCTHGNCDRRAEYLKTVTDLLVDDLEEMVGYWRKGSIARQAVMENPNNGIVAIITGIGSLSYGELAGERIKLGLMLHDPEEEHDCFSDNTHNSHYYDVMGILNVYNGHYVRIDGRVVSGKSLADMVEMKNPKLEAEMQSKLEASFMAASVLKKTAEAGKSYDQMIAENDPAGNQVVQSLVDALTSQTQTLERITAALKIKSVEFEGSDSLDNPGAVL